MCLSTLFCFALSVSLYLWSEQQGPCSLRTQHVYTRSQWAVPELLLLEDLPCRGEGACWAPLCALLTSPADDFAQGCNREPLTVVQLPVTLSCTHVTVIPIASLHPSPCQQPSFAGFVLLHHTSSPTRAFTEAYVCVQFMSVLLVPLPMCPRRRQDYYTQERLDAKPTDHIEKNDMCTNVNRARNT